VENILIEGAARVSVAVLMVSLLMEGISGAADPEALRGGSGEAALDPGAADLRKQVVVSSWTC